MQYSKYIDGSNKSETLLSTTQKLATNTLTIAAIDDCNIFIDRLMTVFEPLRYKVFGINEPLSGMGKLMDENPNLILLDTKLPTIDGYSVCKFLRATSSFKKTPIILLTELDDNKSEKEYANFIGANDVFCKKLDCEKLIPLINKHIS